ncbi:Uncharacterised protein [Mycobacteroides abscessus subsp. abscessus]|nr:Uncharacterised protein [Mycobacteroides abscessus subsp. abscessus]
MSGSSRYLAIVSSVMRSGLSCPDSTSRAILLVASAISARPP